MGLIQPRDLVEVIRWPCDGVAEGLDVIPSVGLPFSREELLAPEVGIVDLEEDACQMMGGEAGVVLLDEVVDQVVGHEFGRDLDPRVSTEAHPDPGRAMRCFIRRGQRESSSILAEDERVKVHPTAGPGSVQSVDEGEETRHHKRLEALYEIETCLFGHVSSGSSRGWKAKVRSSLVTSISSFVNPRKKTPRGSFCYLLFATCYASFLIGTTLAYLACFMCPVKRRTNLFV